MQILCFPWRCTEPHKCNCTSKFTQLLSNGDCHGPDSSVRRFTFERSWRLRWCEVKVLAARADAKSDAARKKLVLADTVLFAELKEPKDEIEAGEAVKAHLRQYVKVALQRTMSATALQCILSFADLRSACHDEQCTLAEYCAHVMRDVFAHSQLAAEARVKPRVAKQAAVSDSESDDEETSKSKTAELTIFDIGGGGADDIVDDTGQQQGESSSRYPLAWDDPQAAIDIALQTADLATSQAKTRRSHTDKQLLALSDAYGPMLAQTFTLPPESARGAIGLHFPADVFNHTLSMQKSNIALAKTQQGHLESEADDGVDLPAQHSDASHAAPCAVVVDLPHAQKGPAAVARHLIENARCTEEQITAIAGLARD